MDEEDWLRLSEEMAISLTINAEGPDGEAQVTILLPPHDKKQPWSNYQTFGSIDSGTSEISGFYRLRKIKTRFSITSVYIASYFTPDEEKAQRTVETLR